MPRPVLGRRAFRERAGVLHQVRGLDNKTALSAKVRIGLHKEMFREPHDILCLVDLDTHADRWNAMDGFGGRGFAGGHRQVRRAKTPAAIMFFFMACCFRYRFWEKRARTSRRYALGGSPAFRTRRIRVLGRTGG